MIKTLFKLEVNHKPIQITIIKNNIKIIIKNKIIINRITKTKKMLITAIIKIKIRIQMSQG